MFLKQVRQRSHKAAVMKSASIGFLIITVWSQLSVADKSMNSPVILIPGITASPIEAKLDKPYVVDFRCTKRTDDYVLIWMDLKHICPTACFTDNMKLHYNTTTRRTKNSQGVSTRVPKFMTATSALRTFSDRPDRFYLKKLINMLENNGYVDGISLQAAPYDFRKGPHEIDEFWVELKLMVEDTYRMNGNKSVTLIGHSMGGPMALAFLHKQTQEFKDKHIHALITLSGAFGGSFLATSTFVKGFAIPSLHDGGDDFQRECSIAEYGIDLLLTARTKPIRTLARSYPTVYWLFPSPLAWNESEILIATPDKNYSLANIKELFWDVDQQDAWEMYQDVLPYTNNFEAPGVEVHCMYGSNVSTLDHLVYDKNIHKFPLNLPEEHHGDGDGVVNLNSLQLCKKWDGQQKQAFHDVNFPNVDHVAISEDDKVFEYIMKAVKLP